MLVLPGPLALAAATKALHELRHLRLRTGVPAGGRSRALFGLVMGALATAVLTWIVTTAAID